MFHALLLCSIYSSSALCTCALLHRFLLCSEHSVSSMCSIHFVNAPHIPFLCTLSVRADLHGLLHGLHVPPPCPSPCASHFLPRASCSPLHVLHTIFTCHVGGGGLLFFRVSVSQTPPSLSPAFYSLWVGV